MIGGEVWCFQHDPESRRQTFQHKQPEFPRLKKASMSKSKMKKMLLIFFDINDNVRFEFTPQHQTVNQTYYVKILKL
jgi:hypothetical protein